MNEPGLIDVLAEAIAEGANGEGRAVVAFTLDTESGFSDAVFITSSVGLGECVVQGAVNPDEFYVHKPTLLSGRPAILRRHLGSKLIKMIYADPDEDLPVKTVDTTIEEQQQFSIRVAIFANDVIWLSESENCCCSSIVVSTVLTGGFSSGSA